MYYEIDDGKWIIAVGVGQSVYGYEISRERYIAICESVRTMPPDTETKTHRLNTDIVWEAVPTEDPEIDDSEAFDIIFGGAE